MAGFAALRTANLRDDEQPAIVFNPVPPGKVLPSGPRGLIRRPPDVSRPSTDEALAFLPVTHLAQAGRDAPGQAVRAHRAVSVAARQIRSHTPLRRLSHTGAGASAGPGSRRRNRCRDVSRSLARDPLRPEGSVRGARDQNHVGRLAMERPGHRQRRHGLYEAESCGRDHGREAVDRSPCRGGEVVRRPDTQPLEHKRGCGGLVGGPRRGHRRRTRRVLHWHRYRRVDHRAV